MPPVSYDDLSYVVFQHLTYRVLCFQVLSGHAEVMFGSHNQRSIQQVVDKMSEFKLPPSSGKQVASFLNLVECAFGHFC